MVFGMFLRHCGMFFLRSREGGMDEFEEGFYVGGWVLVFSFFVLGFV